MNVALPFSFFAFAAQHIDSGLSAILNACAPLFGAVTGALWLGERITLRRAAGLALGVLGVTLEHPLGVADTVRACRAVFVDGRLLALVAIGACLAATLCYGITGVVMKRFARGVPSRGVAAGSQLAAAVVLAPFAFANLPAAVPSALAIANVVALALLSSAVAFLLYFRLIADLGPTRALTVTFLIPVFGVAFGALFLAEALAPVALAGGVLVVIGTAFVLKG